MAEFSLQTFGFPKLSCGNREIKLKLRKGLALLVYVAEARGAVARDVIATLLWPESSIEIARTRLRRTLHRIEIAIGRQIFDTDRITVRWNHAVELAVDSQLFESACDRGDFEEACKHYRSGFLEEFILADCAEFEEWAFFRREFLRSKFTNALERVVQEKNAAGEYFAAAAHATRLVELDPLSEVYGRHLIRSLLLAGDRNSAERHYGALTQRLREELSVAPEAATQALMNIATMPAVPKVSYVNAAGVHLAFETYAASETRRSGNIDILVMPGFVSHLELSWDHPSSRAFMRALADVGRLIRFDRRGIGLSDRVGLAPNIDVTAADIGAVLGAARARRVVLFGASECGPACIKFATDQPRLVAGMILFGSLAKGSWSPDYRHTLKAKQYDAWRQRLISEWGGPAGIETFGPSLSHDPQARAWWAGLMRAASSPGAVWAVLKALRDTDVRELLPKVSVPTLVMHRRNDRAVRIEAGRDLAGRIPGAEFVELDGDDHWFFAGDQRPVLAAIKRFVDSLPHVGLCFLCGFAILVTGREIFGALV